MSIPQQQLNMEFGSMEVARHHENEHMDVGIAIGEGC